MQSNSWYSYFTGVHIHLNTVIVFRDCNEFDYCFNTGNTNSFFCIDYLKWQKLQIPGLMDKSVNAMFLFDDKVMHICVFMQVFQA